MRSSMQHMFSQVPRVEIPRSTFDRSHTVKTTFDAGLLVPIYCDEALPGDTFHLTAYSFARLATPLHPIMDNMCLDFFFFAVPIRLVWDNFQKFMGEQRNPGDSTSYLVPRLVSGTHLSGSLTDYFGIPVNVAVQPNALHYRAYNAIYNEWFRDQNMQNSIPSNTGDGPDAIADYGLQRRGKRHDYFTSALPWPQKGPAVSIPIGTSAAVKTQNTNTVTGTQVALGWLNTSGVAPATSTLGVTNASPYSTTNLISNTPTTTTGVYPSNLYADLSTATAATINQLRQAFQVQKIYERDARGGTRYTELIQSHFGVTSPDARLQRPEYLGGGRADLNINPIAQTSAVTGAPTPLGNLAATGTVVNRGVGFSKSFTEHCVLIGLVCARADITYQQGMNKMWTRQTRFDYYWPSLAQIGEQAITNSEIFHTGTGADATVFGYQERYGEYRYKPSFVTGLFRSDVAGTLDTWHLAQDFAAAPVLNNNFIVEDPPVDRVIATPADPHFLLDVNLSLRCSRPMPVYGVPGNIDRF